MPLAPIGPHDHRTDRRGDPLRTRRGRGVAADGLPGCRAPRGGRPPVHPDRPDAECTDTAVAPVLARHGHPPEVNQRGCAEVVECSAALALEGDDMLVVSTDNGDCRFGRPREGDVTRWH